jgi:hypothetical protein
MCVLIVFKSDREHRLHVDRLRDRNHFNSLADRLSDHIWVGGLDVGKRYSEMLDRDLGD